MSPVCASSGVRIGLTLPQPRTASLGVAMDVQAVTDKLEIHELLSRYARGVDTCDWELWRSVFSPDAYVDYTSAGAIAGSRDEVAEFLAQAIPTLPWTQHYVTTSRSTCRAT